jgi:hypothetical protein
MSFFFALNASLTDFDPSIHARHDLTVLSLTIDHKENDYAHATLHIPTGQLPHSARWLFIAQKMPDGSVVCVFRGTLAAAPHQVSPLRQTVEFIAKPLDADDQINRLVTHHKQSALFDPLLFREDHSERFDVITRTKPVAFYCDPVSLTIQTSCLFHGAKTHNLTQACLSQSLEMVALKPPLSRITVTIEAQWIQYTCGWMDLGRRIARLFPDGVISTFTPKAFRRTWPKTGQNVGKSGYWVAFSKLDERAGYKDGLPEALTCWQNHQGKSKKYGLKRTWFDASLIVGWRIKQKRTERLTFTLKNHHQGIQERSLAVKIPLKRPLSEPGLHPFWVPYTPYSQDDKIQHESRLYKAKNAHTSSRFFKSENWEDAGTPSCFLPHEGAHAFFLSARGKKTFHVVAEMAKTALAHSTRAYRIHAILDANTCPQLSLNDSAHIEHPSLPGGQALGKVIQLRREACGQNNTHILKVTLAVSIGQTLSPIERTQSVNCYSEDYAEHYTLDHGNFETTPEGLDYPSFDDQYPDDMYATLWSSQAQDMTRTTLLQFGPDKQNAIADAHSDDKRPLTRKDIATRLGLHFRHLKTRDNVTHTITLPEPLNWSAPQHITLESPHE